MSVPQANEAGPLPAPLAALPAFASLLAICIGLFVLVGWQIDSELLKRLHPDFVAMNPLTAVLFIACGLGLILHLRFPVANYAVGTVRILALVVILFSLRKLASLIGGSSTPDVDSWLFASKLVHPSDSLPNAMAPNTALNFLVTGVALFGLSFPVSRLWATQACAIFVCFGALLPITGYAYGVRSFSGIASFIPMALHTAIAFFALALGIFFAVPEAPLPQIFASRDSRGTIVRLLLPLSTLLTLFLGWLCLWGVRRELYEVAFGVALFAIGISLIFVALVRWTVWRVGVIERERAEAQDRLAEMNRRKDEMFALVSHDLCSPLTGFQLVVDSLREEEGKPPADLLDMMDYSARRMVSMVRGLLDATKEKQPVGVRLEYSDVKVSDVVRQSMEPLLLNANAKHINLQLDVAPEEPVIHADPFRVSQIFNNLLSNSVKFTGEGGNILVQIEPAFAGVRARVTDSGIGISEEDLPHVFDKYYQGSTKATSGESGIGLGLAVAREMAALHDGYIEVASEPGEGTTFTVYLPVGAAMAA